MLSLVIGQWGSYDVVGVWLEASHHLHGTEVTPGHMWRGCSWPLVTICIIQRSHDVEGVWPLLSFNTGHLHK